MTEEELNAHVGKLRVFRNSVQAFRATIQKEAEEIVETKAGRKPKKPSVTDELLKKFL